MATSKPTIDTAPKRAPNRPRTSPSTVPTMPSMRKPETTNARRNPNSPSPLSPSAIKRSTTSLSKPAATSTSHAKPIKNPSPVITPSKNKVQGLKSNKEGVHSVKTPSPKPKAPAPITRSTSSIRTSNKIANTSVLNRGRSPVAGTRTVNKVGGTSKPTNKRSPSAGRKSGTTGTLSRVNSLPNLNEEVIDMHREKEAEVPAEEEKDVNNSEGKDEETELPPVPLLVEEEEEEKDELREISGENEGQIETNVETVEKKDEIEQTEEVPSVTLTAEMVTEPTLPMPDVTVPDVPVQDVLVPDAPVAAVPESDVPVAATPVPAVPVSAVPVTAVTVVAHGKKEVATSNASIEETRSKLIAERRNKVLALVGAFESVMKDKEKEKKGESQTIGQSVQNVSPTEQNGGSNGKGDDAEGVEA